MDWATIIVGVVTALAALIGTMVSNNKTSAVMGYRMGELEKR